MADLIEDFVAATNDGLAPERYRRWAAIATVAAALNRNVWTSIRPERSLLPNMYILLVGRPGSGKGEALRLAKQAVETQPEIDLAPESITHEQIIKHLADNAEAVGLERKSRMFAIAAEWGLFMREPKPDDMALLARIFDNEDVSRETIGRGRDFAENLYVNILGATPPAWFATGYPENSYEQGLPTRFLHIYDAPPDLSKGAPFVSSPTADAEGNKVGPLFMKRYDALSGLSGFVAWTAEALAFLNDLRLSGFAPAPTDPMLSGYNVRRHLHLSKLALIWAMSRHPGEMIIHLDDVERAWEVMLEAEPDMPLALAQAGGNIYQARTGAVAKFVEEEYKRNGGRPTPEWKVLNTFLRLIPPTLARGIFETMIASKQLKVVEGTTYPNRQFMPGIGK